MAASQDIAITFSEAMTKLGGSYAVDDTIPGMTVQIDGGSELAVTYRSGEDSASWVVRVASLVKNGQTVVLDYVPGTGDLVAVDDATELATVTNQAVTNNLTKRARGTVRKNDDTVLASGTFWGTVLEYGANDPADVNYMTNSTPGKYTTDANGLVDMLYNGATAVDGTVFVVGAWIDEGIEREQLPQVEATVT